MSKHTLKPKKLARSNSPTSKKESIEPKLNSKTSASASSSSSNDGAIPTTGIQCRADQQDAVRLLEDRLSHLTRRLEDALRDPLVNTVRLDHYIGTPLASAKKLLTPIGQFQTPFTRTLAVDRLVG